MNKLRVYTASKIKHRDLLRGIRDKWTEFEFTASWLDMRLINDFDASECRAGWRKNELDVISSDVTMVYAEQGDILRGALVEAGIAIGVCERVLLVGDNYNYGTWQHHHKVKSVTDLEAARKWLHSYAAN